MAEPASWELLAFLKSRVETIRTSAGYRTDLGAGAIVLDDSEEPADAGTPLTVIEASAADSFSGGSTHLNSDVDITIEFSVPRGEATQNPKLQVHRARSDLVRALLVPAGQVPRFIRRLEVTGATFGGFVDENSGVSFSVAQVTARAGLTELHSPET